MSFFICFKWSSICFEADVDSAWPSYQVYLYIICMFYCFITGGVVVSSSSRSYKAVGLTAEELLLGSC